MNIFQCKISDFDQQKKKKFKLKVRNNQKQNRLKNTLAYDCDFKDYLKSKQILIPSCIIYDEKNQTNENSALL